jgi:hypothetical protein
MREIMDIVESSLVPANEAWFGRAPKPKMSTFSKDRRDLGNDDASGTTGQYQN